MLNPEILSDHWLDRVSTDPLVREGRTEEFYLELIDALIRGIRTERSGGRHQELRSEIEGARLKLRAMAALLVDLSALHPRIETMLDVALGDSAAPMPAAESDLHHPRFKTEPAPPMAPDDDEPSRGEVLIVGSTGATGLSVHK